MFLFVRFRGLRGQVSGLPVIQTSECTADKDHRDQMDAADVSHAAKLLQGVHCRHSLSAKPPTPLFREWCAQTARVACLMAARSRRCVRYESMWASRRVRPRLPETGCAKSACFYGKPLARADCVRYNLGLREEVADGWVLGSFSQGASRAVLSRRRCPSSPLPSGRFVRRRGCRGWPRRPGRRPDHRRVRGSVR